MLLTVAQAPPAPPGGGEDGQPRASVRKDAGLSSPSPPPGGAPRLRPEELVAAQNMAKVLNFDKIVEVVKILNDNIYYVERNANPKILFLDTSIQLNRILKSA